jgi:Spy/CpxP family protein refolding chaperone
MLPTLQVPVGCEQPREKEKIMHSHLWSWRRARRAIEKCGGYRGWPACHPHEHFGGGEEGFAGGFGGGGFGVRRPLRFLAYKLDLDEHQVTELARILSELKTERAQAEVDRRRTVSAFAEALGRDVFDAAKAGEGGDLRVQSAQRLREAVLKALSQIHAILNPEQRLRLAYLIRTGTLEI